MALTKDQILQANDLKRETVSVPEWGGEVIVSTVCGSDRDELEQAIFDPQKSPKERMKNLRARVVAMSVVDEHGNRLFSEQDIEALGRKSAKALTRVFNVAQSLNGLSQADIEEITKN